MIEFNVRTSAKNEMLDITDRINGELGKAGLKRGICLIFVPHTTAGVTINEGADPDVRHDIINDLNKLIPRHPGHRHAEGNSDAHLKSTLVGVSLAVPFNEGTVVLGQWQSIYFCEFDGPRNRRMQIHAIPAS